MNFVTASRFTLKRPKWVIANLVETTQAATDNVLKGYDRLNKFKDEEKQFNSELARNQHSYMNLNARSKVTRDVFGATILPSNLSYSNMKKLSMNKVKLEEIPFIDEGDFDEVLETGKKTKLSTSQTLKSRKKDAEKTDLDYLFVPDRKYLELPKTHRFEEIPGPRLLENLSSTVMDTARLITVYFVLRLLRSGSFGPFSKYGPIVRLPEIMGGKILLVSRAEDIAAIYEQDKRHPTSSSLDALECSRVRRHGKGNQDDGISIIDWDEGKKAVDEVLLKDEEKYFDNLEEIGSNLVKRIKCLKNPENEVSSDFITDINHWSLECLFQILFDKSSGFLDLDNMKSPSNNAKLLAALNEATRSLNLCEGGLQLWRFMKTSTSTSLDTSCEVIESVISHYVHETQMSLLSRDENESSGTFTLAEGMLLKNGMTRTDVVTYLLDTVLIGTNTTTSALVFLLYHLASNPKSQTKLFKEIKNVLPEKYSRLEYDQLNSLKYLEACLKESLRLKMPMPILTKYLKKDVVLSNFQIPRGTFVLMAAQLEALKEENFEGAQEFRPGRWLDLERKHPFTFLPLSACCQRCCFETRQAEISVITCVAQIIRNFIVQFNNGILNATNSTISYPITPFKFRFLDREA